MMGWEDGIAFNIPATGFIMILDTLISRQSPTVIIFIDWLLLIINEPNKANDHGPSTSDADSITSCRGCSLGLKNLGYSYFFIDDGRGYLEDN